MQSLHELLKAIEDKELSHQVVFKRLQKINSALDNVIWISILISLVIIGCFIIFLDTYIIPIPNGDLSIILTFYGGLFLIQLLHETVIKPQLKSFVHFYFNINKNEYKSITQLKTTYESKKNEIQKQIKEENKKVFKEKERKLAERLNVLTGLAEKKNIQLGKLEELRNILLAEHLQIKNFGYQIHSSVYYNNRFAKINQALLTQKDDTSSTPTNTTEPTIKQTPAESKSYIPIDWQQEAKKNEVTKPTDEQTSTFETKIGTTNTEIPNTIKVISHSANHEEPIPKDEKKTSSELFGLTDAEDVKLDTKKIFNPKQPIKIDFQKLNKHRQKIGELGELYVFEKEQTHLYSQGKINQSKEVIHVSLTSDSEGYDIISFTDTGERKYIEVKTTTGNEFEPFYLSNFEVEAMRHLNNYWIYRVYNFNIELKKGDLYVIDCNKDLDKYYNIEASTFRVTPNKPDT